jgi:hypothetical protein
VLGSRWTIGETQMTAATTKAASAPRKATAVSMRQALSNKKLLGKVFAPSLLRGDTWLVWRALLVAANGEALTDEERVAYLKLTGRQREPLERVDELVVVAGRRSGKSLAIATLICYVACLVDYSAVLVPGERGCVLCLSPTARQSNTILNFVVGILEDSPMLSTLIKSKTADSISLTNGIDIEIRPANFRGARGVTAVAIVLDEAAFFFSEDSSSSNPDKAILDAVRPSLLTTNGMLAMISSPYWRKGIIYDAWNKHHGEKGDKSVLVAAGSTKDFNPTVSQRRIDLAYAEDAIAAQTEYGGAWRSDVEAFLSIEAVRAVVMTGVFELPYQSGRDYIGFVDPAGGSGGGDSMTLGIAFKQDDIAILACVRETKPPFSPAAVVAEYAQLLKKYGCKEVIGDAWGSQFVEEAFLSQNVRYRQADKNRSELYLEALAAISSRQVSLLDNQKLIQQLVSLDRRTSSKGKDSVDHRKGQHDDLANSAIGAVIYALSSERRRATFHFSSIPNRDARRNDLLTHY